MDRKNHFFPIAELEYVRAALRAKKIKFKIRYRGPRSTGMHTHPVTGETYFRDRTMCNQDCVKSEATHFVVYTRTDPSYYRDPSRYGSFWAEALTENDIRCAMSS